MSNGALKFVMENSNSSNDFALTVSGKTATKESENRRLAMRSRTPKNGREDKCESACPP